MRRKIISQGGGKGLTLYLPKKWADERNIKGGDEIEIEENLNSLIIKSKN